MTIWPDYDTLLEAATAQVQMQAVLGDPEADPITHLQAQNIAQLMQPAINREEYFQLREFATLAMRGMGPCMREDIAAILSKLLDNVPVEKGGGDA